MSTFAHNERAFLLKLVTQLCANENGSHDKLLYKSFSNNVHSIIEQSEEVEIDISKNKRSELGDASSNRKTAHEALRNPTMPCVAGFGLKKLFE